MFSVEFDFDDITITVMDDSGNHSDLIVNSFDDIVYIRQYDEENETESIIDISPKQWEELIHAIHSQEGFFKRG
jgi:hypothetical protein|tara:strand:+ start:421 stop:642 length:222 start_codon:yes stop_codon:yes gene_type:complete